MCGLVWTLFTCPSTILQDVCSGTTHLLEYSLHNSNLFLGSLALLMLPRRPWVPDSYTFPVLCQSSSHSLELSHIWAPPGKLTWLLCCLTKCPTPYNHICVYPMLFLPHILWIPCGQVSLMYGCICRAHYTLLGIVSKTEKNILPEHCKTDLLLKFIIKQISVLTHIIRHFFSLQGFLQFSDLPL